MAARVYEFGRDATVAFALAVAAQLARSAAPSPHAPPGSVPVYAKPGATGASGCRRRKRSGARSGHEGHRRPTPPPDRVEEVAPIRVCPDCNGPVLPARRRRRRTVEDMPPDLKVEAVEYVVPQHWCPCRRKHVEPRLAAAMPGAAIGHGITALTTVFHYGLGLTIDQVREVLLSPLRTRLSAGGPLDLWRRTAGVLLSWYEQIGTEAKASATLHADETGWRVNGDTHWVAAAAASPTGPTATP